MPLALEGERGLRGEWFEKGSTPEACSFGGSISNRKLQPTNIALLRRASGFYISILPTYRSYRAGVPLRGIASEDACATKYLIILYSPRGSPLSF